MKKGLLSKLTQKEFHQWSKICSGISLVEYSIDNKLSYKYVRKKWSTIKKKLHISGYDWQQHYDFN